MKNKILLTPLLILAVLIMSSCDMDEHAITNPEKEDVFGSESGLEAYSNSFYDGLPTLNAQAEKELTLVDYGAPTAMNAFIRKNAYSQETSSGWAWGNLRNINYFIKHLDGEEASGIPEATKENYMGIARFFRAWFYFEMVKSFGDVPWVDHPLERDEEDILYGKRDSRELVMENVYEDLMFAGENIARADDATQSSLVSNWAAYAVASRVALFEGTFRKYHNLNLETSSETWLKRAEEAANKVIQESGKSLNNDYRELFTSDVPPQNETILALAADDGLGVRHNANWKWTSETFGSALNLIRPFVNTYLQKDGTPYSERSGWKQEDFYDEFQDRDERLKATLRYPGYEREGSLALPEFDGYARLGYQPIKLTVDATRGDDQSLSTHAVQLIRYGEVLLNYAEAKAELGTLTNDDWAMTIGALRERAGITGGLNQLPTKVDQFFKETYFPNINDPVLLEVRRERAVELVLEGFRFDDLRRWKTGDLLKMSNVGMFIADLNKPLDVDHNGVDDVIYYTGADELNAALKQSNNDNIMKVEVSTDLNASSKIQVQPADGKGYNLAWDKGSDVEKVWGEKQYLYPIPVAAINENPNLEQNTGWEDGTTNDGN